MIQTSSDNRRSAFSGWLRTGRLPTVRDPDGIERKFNPWHDPADGRFTFAGSGQHFGGGERAPGGAGRGDPARPRIATPNAHPSRAEQPARRGKRPEDRGSIAAQPQRPVTTSESQPGTRSNPIVEFVGGVGEELRDSAKGIVTSAYSALTTNPVTTVRETNHGIAGMIDHAIAAEDTPARVQISRATEAIAHASARDFGRGTTKVAVNTAMVVAPEAAMGKISALRRLRNAVPRPVTYDPPQIGWVKENLGPDKPWKRYNDSATGARPGQAPTLMRTMPDGSKRPVKFDGVEGEYLIDRKWSISGKPRARAQILRQSDVLAQHRLIGTWEVPDKFQRDAAIKLLRKLKVTNIKVRVVKP